MVSDEQKHEYHKKLDRFYSEYESYLNELDAFSAQENRIIPIKIELRNIGAKPAENIDISVHFPDGFSLYAEGDTPKPPVEPKAPAKPKSMIELIGEGNNELFSRPDYSNLANLTASFNNPAKPSTFKLRKTNSYEMQDSWKRIKHNHVEKIKTLYLIFDTFDSASSFKIDYTITADNIIDPIKEELNIRVEVT